MDIQSNSNNSKNQSDSSGNAPSLNLFALIDHEHHGNAFTPYRSHFQLNSIGSAKSRQSRDSDLLNRLAKEGSSKASMVSEKSFSRNISETKLGPGKPQQDIGSSNNSNSNNSENHQNPGQKPHYKIQAHMMAPKLHNCVCFVAQQCLKYNCNCFLSPFTCTPECCPNCLTLKTNLPNKVTNHCSCKKTKCLKLYCECLSNGIYCGVMCRCELCQNHENSTFRLMELQGTDASYRGCACQKSHCLKKYCQCYNRGLKCTPKCGCFNCHNMIKTKPEQPKQSKEEMMMEAEQPEMEFEPINFFQGRKK